MPSGTARGIALGIEKGVDNFLNTFLQVKQYKAQEKYRRLQPIISVIQSQINDPNAPLDVKIKAIDSLPHLLGSFKSGDEPLSKHFGLDQLSQQMLETGQEVTRGTPSKTITDQYAVDFNKAQEQNSTSNQESEDGTLPQPKTLMATSIQTRPTETTRKSILKRRGELSDVDVQTIKQKSLYKEQQSLAFEKQYQLNIQQAELQADVLAKQGWKNNDDWSLDETSNQWQQNWFNPITKESYTQKLPPGVVPIGVIQKQIQATGSSNKSGVSKAYSTLRTSIAVSMGKEEDDPEVQLATANLWKNNFQAGVDYKKQGVAGTRAIQPGQQEGLNISKEKLKMDKNQLRANYDASLANVTSLEERKHNQWGLVSQKKAELDAAKDEYDVGDPEYLKIDQVYRTELQRANDLETEYNKALRERDSFKGQVDRLDTKTQGNGIGLSPRMKVRIKTFRLKNPNFSGTDEQAAEILKAAGFSE